MSMLSDLADMQGNMALVYEDPRFIMSFKHHLDRLTDMKDMFSMPVDPHMALMYRGDYRGLVRAMGIQDKYHILISILNKVDDSTMYDGLSTSVLVMDDDSLEGLAEQFRAQNK